MESMLRLKDNIWDIFEFTEYETKIAEYSSTQKVSSWIPPETKVSDRRYLAIYLRQDEFV